MYAYLRRRYLESSLSETGLDNAVDVYRWITRQQATTIKAEKTRLENAAAAEQETEETPAEPETTEE